MRHHAARRLLTGTLALTAACAPSLGGGFQADDAARSARRTEIEAMLARAAFNWNRGDLDAFVDDYLPGAATTYVGGRGVVRGSAAIKAVYAPRFAPNGLRDSLSFELVDVDPLAPDLLNVIATWQLSRHLATRDSITGRGPTSLVMRRVDGRWRIAHDHSS